MNTHNLLAISPVDGRYAKHLCGFENYFSEYAFIKYRVKVEVEYFIALCEVPLPQLASFPKEHYSNLRSIYTEFSTADALRVKEIESRTNHDVKAVEYFLKELFQVHGLNQYSEFIHFGLTSQDINNCAIPLILKDFTKEVYLPSLERFISKLDELSDVWKDVPMLARTHGQAASPTRVGKEILVFSTRIKEQIRHLNTLPFSAKFGGATGNFNAHFAAYPSISWHSFADNLVNDVFELSRSFPTTQIEHYDNIAALFDNFKRINTILIDLTRDFWHYISIDYFKQKSVESEVGSSAMPHKVNPIDFENGEGNLGIANALFEHLASKLPISRLQRDLTDSTVLRNIGVPLAHTSISINSILKGINKLSLNESVIEFDLSKNWAVVAEAIQTILRREGYPNPYEELKKLTRGRSETISQESLIDFINNLNISKEIKEELLLITPFNYVGR